MDRRKFLKGFNASLAAACSALLALPGVRFLFSTTRSQRTNGATFKRVARLTELPVGRPISVAITGGRRDAWTTFPDGPIGQVWLVRRDDASVPPGECRIDAYSSVCPHLGCRIRVDAGNSSFVCPCHRGVFDLHGQPISKQRLGRDNPAPGQLATYPVQIVTDKHQESWIEIEYPV